MGELFDRFVVVDWSASGRPKSGADSIWIAAVDAADAAPRLSNPPTRRRAERELDALVAVERRTLLTVDASLGYPVGASAWFGLDGGAPWQAMWDHLAAAVVDDACNRSNRFDVAAALNRRGGSVGPFWGRPAGTPIEGLDVRKPPTFPVPEFRHVEAILRAAGRRPASGWQLLGAGSVGSQSLTLLPVLRRRRATAPTEVWPFTTGLTAPVVAAGTSVVVEIWPTAFDLELPIDRIRDAAQVDGVARRLRDADTSGALASWFQPTVDGAIRPSVEAEEGWVLQPA